MNAAPILLEGKDLTVDAAKGLGLIHEVVPAGELLAKAKAWLMAPAGEQVVPEYAGKGAKAIDGRAVQPWDRKGFKTPGFPGGQVWSPTGVQTFIGGNAMIAGKTNGVYPAPKAIMSCVYEACSCRSIRRCASRPATSSRCCATRGQSMIRTCSSDCRKRTSSRGGPKACRSRRKKIASGRRPDGLGHCHRLGAGRARHRADRPRPAAADRQGPHRGRARQARQARPARPARRDALLAKVTATPDFGALKDVQLVVEAVFEQREVKAEATKKAEAAMPKEAVFASNTSTLPITGLAEASSKPDQFIGLHFFSPVEKMPLVEIIVGKKTSPETLARAMDFVQKIRKTPIVVNDSRGFYANRCVLNYIAEGHRMLLEGVPPAMIENVARQAGMPVGPLSLNDEVAIDLSWKIMDQARRVRRRPARSSKVGTEDILELMVKKLERFGRKNGKGFYEYPADGKKRLWPELAKHFPPDPKLLYGEGEEKRAKEDEIKKRLLYVQAVDTVRCLEANVLTNPQDGDVGSIMGLGFAPQTGGAVSLIDQVGVKTFVAECDDFAKKYGPQFEVAEDAARHGGQGAELLRQLSSGEGCIRATVIQSAAMDLSAMEGPSLRSGCRRFLLVVCAQQFPTTRELT